MPLVLLFRNYRFPQIFVDISNSFVDIRNSVTDIRKSLEMSTKNSDICKTVGDISPIQLMAFSIHVIDLNSVC